MTYWILVFFCVIAILVLLNFIIQTVSFTWRIPLLTQVSIASESMWPSLTLIIPCCNEEPVLQHFLDHTLGHLQYPELQIIFVNDRSTDQTASILQKIAIGDARVRVHTITSLPSGWLGKVNALKEGVTLVKTEWIAFADADAEFTSTSLKKALTLCQNQNLDYLGVFPQQKSTGFCYRSLVAFVEHANALMINLSHLANLKKPDAYGTGALALFRSSMLTESRWDWLRLDVIDDRALPLMLKLLGAKIGLAHGYNEIFIKWYDTGRAMMRGVEKNAYAIHEFKPSLVCINIVRTTLWLAMLLSSAFLTPIKSLQVIFLTVLTIYYLVTGWQYWKFNHKDPWPVLLLPFTGFMFSWYLIRGALMSMRQGGIEWRNTFYSINELKQHQKVFLLTKKLPVPPPT